MENKKIYSDKQRELMRLWQDGKLKRLNILEGSVRSGKTWISLVLWAFWVATTNENGNYLMCAKTLTSLKRNCLDLLQTLIGTKNFSFSLSQKQGTLFGRRIYLEGANDARSEDKIRGLTLGGAYCDELTLFPEDFFVMLLSRLSEPKAKLIATTNPDTPKHWLKEKYLDNEELDLLAVKFLLDDNHTLDEDYKTNLKKEYTGAFYQRFILGNWVAAEGAIYLEFADNAEKFTVNAASDIVLATVGVDFGGTGSYNAFSCVGFTRGFKDVFILDEYYKKPTTPEDLNNDLCDFILKNKAKYNLLDVYCDSAEQLLINGIKMAVFKRKVAVNIHNARKNEVTERIRLFQSLMAQERFKILSHCKETAAAFQSAVWDSKSLVKDKRLDNGTSNIDSLDAVEYAAEKYMNEIIKTRFV